MHGEVAIVPRRARHPRRCRSRRTHLPRCSISVEPALLDVCGQCARACAPCSDAGAVVVLTQAPGRTKTGVTSQQAENYSPVLTDRQGPSRPEPIAAEIFQSSALFTSPHPALSEAEKYPSRDSVKTSRQRKVWATARVKSVTSNCNKQYQEIQRQLIRRTGR